MDGWMVLEVLYLFVWAKFSQFHRLTFLHYICCLYKHLFMSMCLQRNIVMCTDSPFANMRCDHFNCFAFCIVSLSVCTIVCVSYFSLSSSNMESKSSRGMRVTSIIIAHCKQFTVEESLLYFPLSTTTSPLSTQRQFDSAIVQLFSFRSDVDMTTWSVNRCRGSTTGTITARLHFHVLIVFISFLFSFFFLSSKCFKSAPFYYYRHSFLANPRFIYAPNVVFVLLCCRCSLKETFFLSFFTFVICERYGSVGLDS